SPTPDNQKPDVVETNTISGRAADGYLQYATVCLDLNNNARCDADEPATISGDGGKFELTLADEQMAKLSSSRLVVETKAGVTVDEDYGVAIKRGYTLQAPVNVEKKGEQFVSPITSLVVSK